MSLTHRINGTSTCLRLVLAGLLALAGAQASANLVTSRTGFNDFIDWGQLGPETANPDPFAEPASVASSLGVTASVNNANGALYRFDQGSLFGGNFASAAALIGTLFETGPIVIDFAVGVSKVGAQIQSQIFGVFGGLISVYDASNNLLENYAVSGTSNAAEDDSAIFIGVVRQTADIDRVEFMISRTGNAGGPVTDPSELDFAINEVALSREVIITPGVPEPESLALVGLALAGLAGSRRRAAG